MANYTSKMGGISVKSWVKELGENCLGCLAAGIAYAVSLNGQPISFLTGLTVSLTIISGKRLIPWIGFGVALAAFFDGISSLGIVMLAGSYMLTGWLGHGLLGPWVRAGQPSLERPAQVFRLFLAASICGLSPAAVTGLIEGEAIRLAAAPIWLTLWVANLLGVAILVPLVLTWVFHAKDNWQKARFTEYLVFLLLLMITGFLIFAGLSRENGSNQLTLTYILLVFLVWAAFRFSLLETTTAIVVVSVLILGYIPSGFVAIAGNEGVNTLLSVQLFLFVMTLTGLTMSTMVAERSMIAANMARLERLNLVGEMAAGVAHEIRNPMTALRGFLQMLAGRKENAGQKQYFHLMLEEVDRANGIIAEYLTLARNNPEQRKMVNLNRVVEALRPLIEADAAQAGQHLQVDLGEIPELYLDEKEIRQLILNLCRNGFEAMSPGQRLTIGTFPIQGDVNLAIRDQGPGIPPQVLKQLGTPFFTTKENCTGLGLVVCYRIAERNGATIKVESGAGGTAFLVRFRAAGWAGN